ncbi:MAG: AAA family ATPase [Candidatus Zixiibacteriota bacterium]|jgi:hypothetical protein
MIINELLIENVRCFARREIIEIKPITLLVGKNSTGKTTLLATLAALSAGKPLLFRPDFNVGPFNLGSFDNIVTNFDGKGGKKNYINLGVLGVYEETEFIYLAEYKKHKRELGPILNKAILKAKIMRMAIRRNSADKFTVEFHFSKDGTNIYDKLAWNNIANPEKRKLKRFSHTFDVPIETFNMMTPDALLYPIITGSLEDIKREKSEKEIQTINKIKDNLPVFGFPFEFPQLASGTLNVAPIRSKPERTYETYKKKVTSEGTHIPFLIEADSRTKKTLLINALNEFGKTSGLYTLLDVKQLGSPKGNRFELMVSINGPGRNIVDVGYGVSQVLPVIVEALQCPDGAIMTLQQPEVHLHPEAQAAIGTLLAVIAGDRDKAFVIETHSDFIVDRIRIEISKGNIKPDDVSVLFLDLKDDSAAVNRLRLNEKGTFVRQPASYRDFFLREAHDLLRK